MRLYTTFVSGYTEEETPVPIPNTAVKLLMVDGTYLARDWESRMSLALFEKAPVEKSELFLYDKGHRKFPETKGAAWLGRRTEVFP